MWKPKDPKTLELAGTLAEGSWLGEICCTLMESLVRLNNLSGLPETPAVATARAAALRGVIRNCLDFPVAAHFMKLGPFGTLPHGWFGAAGAVTSCIQIWELWPTIVVGVPKKA